MTFEVSPSLPGWLLLGMAILLGAYLLGAIPTGYIAGRLLTGIDIRQYGSGSTGATNVLRTLGKGPAFLVLLVDAAKGVLAIAYGHWIFTAGVAHLLPLAARPQVWLPWIVALAGLSAILGHSKSIWLGFSGGKSVGTSLGVLLAMSWQVGLAALGGFGCVLALSQIVSLSSMAAALTVAVSMFLLNQPLPYQLFGLIGGLYVVWLHRSNIQRLLTGTEPRLGQKLTTESEQNLH